MAERFTFDPEGCYVKPSDLPFPDWELDKLIGRTEHTRILMGALPFFDEDGNNWQFRLDGMYAKGIHPSRTFLFAGPEGCGKRTMNAAFLMRLYDDYRKQEAEIRYYEFSLQTVKAESKEESLKRLDTMMSAIHAMCLKPEHEEIPLYLSFGDLRPILKKKQLAERFAYWIRRLPSDETHMSISAGWCHREPSALPESIQRAFRVLYLSLPEKDDRITFFQMMMSPYPKLVWEMQPEELAENTEGFTFRMLNEVSEMFYSWVMTCLQEAQLPPDSFILGTAEEPFVIPLAVCKMILENIRSRQIRRRQKVQPVPMPVFPAVTPQPVQPVQPQIQPQPVQPQQPPAAQENEEENGGRKKPIAAQLNTHSELVNYAETMHPIAILQIITSKNNTDPNEERNAEGEKEQGERIPASQS